MHDALVAELSRSYGTHAYAKWSGAFWRLISLVDLGVGPGHAGAVAAAEETLEWVASPRRLAEIHKRRIDGRVRRCASMEGRALQTGLDVGLRGDSRLDTLAESLVATQWPDGGWNCDRKPHVTHSSFNETWGPILGLARYGATEAAERGADFLLAHKVVFSHRTGQPAHPVMLKLHFPAYWHYDCSRGSGRSRRPADCPMLAPPMPSTSWKKSVDLTERGVRRGAGGSDPARKEATSRSSTGATPQTRCSRCRHAACSLPPAGTRLSP